METVQGRIIRRTGVTGRMPAADRKRALLAWEAARASNWGTRSERDAVVRRLCTADDVVVGIAAVRTAAHFRNLRGAEELATQLLVRDRPEG